jgi:hypothetical protein
VMQSTKSPEQALVSLLQQGIDGSDRPPEDVTAFAEAVFSWRAIDAELDHISSTRTDQEMFPDE